MKDLLEKGYARKAKQSADPGKIWYLPHHGVYNENKEKIRVVFDCGAEYRGKTLNAELISGPDLTNQLVGVLNRFREGKIAVTADIEAMYYQVFVKEEHRSMLRFLWWEDDNAESEIIDLEMNVHVFGSTSSASCSNYALKKTASDNEDAYNKEVSYTLIKNFYVDDLLRSHDEVNQLIDVIKDVRRMCQEGGFNLTKFTSSNKEVLESIPECHRRKEVKDFKMMTSLPSNRALGVVWSLEADEFRFELAEKSKPVTRRGMLSTLSSFYDPLGFILPYLLPGKIILQQLCASKVGWDDPVSLDVEKEWKSWLNSLKFVESVRIPRCLKPETLSEIVEASLNHFSDASEYGYGQVSYLCLIDTCGRISCRLLVSKSRVAPLKYTSIPRLELTAATISVKMSVMLKKEIQMKITKERFWTDSQMVLGYLRNQKKKFKIFVANRVQMIKNNSNINDWCYVPSKENPADIASRGGDASKLEQLSFWQDGPAFLKKPEKNWVQENSDDFEINDEDPEVKAAKVQAISVEDKNDVITKLVMKMSNWNRLRRVLAWVLLAVNIFKTKRRLRNASRIDLTVEQVQNAERLILRRGQAMSFDEEFKRLRVKNAVRESSKLYSLDPFIDSDGIIRVGGRIQNSSLDFNCIHPVVLSKNDRVSQLIIEYSHMKVAHGGRSATINEVRNEGFWIISINALARKILYYCVMCRCLRGRVGKQIMAKLPKERLIEAPPFTYCGVDCFGPFVIKERRKELKRYGVLFTCFSCRAVHIEIANNLETDTFILAL